VLNVLDGHSHRRAFGRSWQSFMRDCALLLLPSLPAEASEWVAAADEFEAGRLSAGELLSVRVRAWQFHDAPREAGPTEQSGLRAVMYRLWPPGESGPWIVSAEHFLEFCAEAGLSGEQLWQLLRARFGAILGEVEAPNQALQQTPPHDGFLGRLRSLVRRCC
jgi:hypothetical protein